MKQYIAIICAILGLALGFAAAGRAGAASSGGLPTINAASSPVITATTGYSKVPDYSEAGALAPGNGEARVSASVGRPAPAGPVSYKWSGPGRILNPTSAATDVTGLKEGTHLFSVRITIGRAFTRIQTVAVTVSGCKVVANVSCGAGRLYQVVNRGGTRPIRATVRYTEVYTFRPAQTKSVIVNLAPGAVKNIGCSAAGPGGGRLERVSVTVARYQ